MILGQAAQENREKPHVQCIYKIENLKRGTVYIGSTKDFAARYRQHKSRLTTGTHNSKNMQRDFDRGDKFDMTIIEDCTGLSQDELLQHEQAQIIKYGVFVDLYNAATAWAGALPQTVSPISPKQFESITAERDELRRQLEELRKNHAEELAAVQRENAAKLEALTEKLDRLRTDHRQQLDDLRHDLTESRLQLDRLTFDRDQLQQQLDNEKWWSNHYKESFESELEEHRMQRETSRKLETTLFEMVTRANNTAFECIRQSQQQKKKPTLWQRLFGRAQTRF